MERKIFDNMFIIPYMAGIIDGEGCLTISKQIRKNRKSPTYRTSVTVCNTDKRIIEIFPKYFGGVLYKRKDARVNKQWADSLTWHCPDNEAVSFLELIKPYLRAKKIQAQLIIDFQNMKTRYKRKAFGQGLGTKPLNKEDIRLRDSFYKKVKALNKKGVYSRKLNLSNFKK